MRIGRYIHTVKQYTKYMDLNGLMKEGCLMNGLCKGIFFIFHHTQKLCTKLRTLKQGKI